MKLIVTTTLFTFPAFPRPRPRALCAGDARPGEHDLRHRQALDPDHALGVPGVGLVQVAHLGRQGDLLAGPDPAHPAHL